AGPFGQPVEQIRVDVIPDPEREDAERPAAMLRLIGDALRVRFAHGRHPVRQEHHHAQVALGWWLGEGLRERAGDVGPAVGVSARPGASSSMKNPSSPTGWLVTSDIPTRRWASGRNSSRSPWVAVSASATSMRSSRRLVLRRWVGEYGSPKRAALSTCIRKLDDDAAPGPVPA